MQAAEVALPATADLTDAQLRGTACVWCAMRLDTATAVDFGVRPDPDCPWASWFPRACRSCAEGRP